ncbi:MULTISPECIES: DUF1127 domain-containing protein [Pseudomonas]|uniref:DUF1127 domain-containing protein n=1 Tax=Pseudomonas nitroreducens TaxID=46680 RepID=A0A6G6IPB0_PSENT|nr:MULTISPECIES: DUF1127 domain-containing protein [Pseudomonas]MBG6290086.1 DUF1127 domain-containing protein [Pseudomonas nitroreducens]MDG9852369.1 DUF1127 domain-containing protein [Pseudomonas nitroreducens]MDH1071472.1 DUF1127 domain-containing protein [Pseudomonas nitroreducens]NMZ59954.1 DUF1127 domain-containing protein [Pseudomonas nitroreducens]NMZ76371.1 DUF1127 domain-containing protein [Pseudomonas nitroreducens]
MQSFVSTAHPKPDTPRPGLRHLLRQWHQNARTRRQLAELSSLQLADLGISPSERVREISKPFWR